MHARTPEKCRLCSMYYDAGNFCAKLAPNELAALASESQTANIKRGTTLNDETIMHWPILSISSGVMSLQHLLHDGRKTIAAFFMRGDIIDMRNSSKRKLGSLIALSNVELCWLSPQIFEKIVSANTKARALVWENLRDQTFRAIEHSSDLAKKQAREKLAAFIFECRHRNPNKAMKDHVEIPILRLDLAEYLGMQPETVSRTFKKLEDNGIIKISDLSVIQILDLPALRKIANGHRAKTRHADAADYKILTVGR